jgi:uncharacterized protein (DUF1501 family)
LNGVYGPPSERLRAAVGDLAHHDGSDPGIATAATTIIQSAQLRFQLRSFAANQSRPPAGVDYPATRDSFAQHLQTLAGLLGAGFPIRAVAMRASGSYDTHSAEAQPLTQGLKTTADSLLAFQRDLEARGIADRVLIHVWTEFGRRGKENASGGTDHGAAGAGFLIGTRVSGKMIGEFPGLADGTGLDRLGNLVPTADFRALYASLLEQWFQTDAASVIPGAKAYPRYSLLRS